MDDICDAAPHRLLVVSNRLPVTAQIAGSGVRLVPSSGGLASGLRPWHEASGGLWLGWPGDISRFTVPQRDALDRQLAERAIVPVHLSKKQIDGGHHGFANRTIWPLFHYLVDRVPVDAAGWDAYRDVNATFADAVVTAYRPGDTIWVHDYQLMLVPDLLRQRLPKARIGFFLHIPFPSSEVFRILPSRRELLRGLLGADLLGFHTFGYLRHFVSSLLHVEGLEGDIDRVRIGNRDVRLGVFPMGVDAEHFAALARDPQVIAEADAIRRDAGGRRIVLGVDRLDYTKGLPRRMHAVEQLLLRDVVLRDAVRYIQVAVPSRGEVESYQRFRRLVEEQVGHVNGACGTLRSTPIHYIHRSLSERQLVALYCAADVMLVTPLRDGMNLVAKEFAACQVDGDGVLILSEFTGAAGELDGALIVNPYAIAEVGAAIERALVMPLRDRHARMRRLRQRVAEYDVHAWARSFLDQLGSASNVPRVAGPDEPPLSAAIAAAQQCEHVHLLLDYDGTLVPFARTPQLAVPDDELMAILDALATSRSLDLQLVSGRPRETMQAWFGHLPISLWAEHGFWHRAAGESEWKPSAEIDPGWKQRIYPLLEQFVMTTPGSHIESKTASLAWHYRGACREFGGRQARELRMLLGDTLSNQPLEVLQGGKVIEIRSRGVSKALVVDRLPSDAARRAAVIAIGDDQTDEDLFTALPTSSLTVAVGRPLAGARYCVPDFRAVRQILRTLAWGTADKFPTAPRSTDPGDTMTALGRG